MHARVKPMNITNEWRDGKTQKRIWFRAKKVVGEGSLVYLR